MATHLSWADKVGKECAVVRCPEQISQMKCVALIAPHVEPRCPRRQPAFGPRDRRRGQGTNDQDRYRQEGQKHDRTGGRWGPISFPGRQNAGAPSASGNLRLGHARQRASIPLEALPTLLSSLGAFCLFELRVFQALSRQFTVHLFSTWMPSSTRCQHFLFAIGQFVVA